MDVLAPREWVDALVNSRGAARADAQSRGQELVRLTPDHLAAVLERMLHLLHDAGRLDDETIATFAGDALVAPVLGHRLQPEERPRDVDATAPEHQRAGPRFNVDDIPSGGVRTTSLVRTTPIVVCRIATELFAFLDECARCHGTWEGAALSRRLGPAGLDVVLRCPSCKAHYDVRRGGACLEDDSLHLTPLPLSDLDSTTSVAVTPQDPMRRRI